MPWLQSAFVPCGAALFLSRFKSVGSISNPVAGDRVQQLRVDAHQKLQVDFALERIVKTTTFYASEAFSAIFIWTQRWVEDLNANCVADRRAQDVTELMMAGELHTRWARGKRSRNSLSSPWDWYRNPPASPEVRD